MQFNVSVIQEAILTEAKLQVLRKCNNDLIYFGKVITPDTFYLPTPQFHNVVAPKLLNTSIKKYLAEAPRGTSKSSLTVKSVHHHYLFEAPANNMDAVIVIQSKTRREAIKRLWAIKNTIEYNNIYIDLFGYHGEKTAEIWREDYIKFRYNNHWVTIGAIGTGQQVRGILEGDTRVTYLLLDDPEDEENTATGEQMDKNYEKFLAGVASVDMRFGYIRVIGTPIVRGCMVDRIASAPTGWEVDVFSAIQTSDCQHPEVYKNKLLWGEMYSQKDLDDIKADYESKGMIRRYYADYECTVSGKDEAVFKNWRYWDGSMQFDGEYPYLVITHLGSSKNDMITLAEPKIVAVNNFLGIDPASSTKQTADQSVTFSISYSGVGDIYTHPYYNQRVAPTAHALQIINSIKQYKYRYGSVETVAYQEMLRDYLRAELRKENLSMPGLEFKWQERTEKNRRLEALEPFFSTDHVFIKVGSDELEDQLKHYPHNKKSPNLLDGFYYATRRLIKPDHASDNYLKQPEPMSDEELIQQFRDKHPDLFREKKQPEKGWLAVA